MKVGVAGGYAAGVAGVAALCVWAGAGFAPLMLIDSYEYIGFSPRRTSFYPLFIAAFGGDLQAVVYAQCAIYFATLAGLVYVLHRRFQSHLISAGFGLAAAGNPFLWDYHAGIMAESLTLSGLNLLLVALLSMQKEKRGGYLLSVCLAGLAIGIVVGLRPAMWSFAPVMGLAAALFWRRRDVALPALACLIASIAAVAMLEAAGHRMKHDERQPVLPSLLYGRAAMLTTEPGFVMPDLPPRQRETLEQTALTMQPVKNYLQDDEVSPLLKHSLLTTLEIFAGEPLYPHLAGEGLISAAPENIARDKKQIGIAVIKANFASYLKLSAEHYARLWSGGLATYAYVRSHESLPAFGIGALDEMMRNLSAPFAYTERYGFAGLWALFFTVALFGALCLLLSLWSWARVIISAATRQPLPPTIALIAILLFFAQANLLLVCLTHPGGLRYLLPALPFLQLACLLWLRMLLSGPYDGSSDASNRKNKL